MTKPKKTTIEGEADERRRAACDLVLSRAVHLMQQELEAPVGMILDRLITYAAAQAVVCDGEQLTARNFRTFAERIEGGLFHSLTKEGGKCH